MKKSKKEKKPVLIYFTGFDWCTPCQILDRDLFGIKKFKTLSDRDLILYEADSPRNKDLVKPKRLAVNYKLVKKYRVDAFPTLILVNSKERMIDHKRGLLLVDYYYPFIESVVKNY